jgi:hypothetical protein
LIKTLRRTKLSKAAKSVLAWQVEHTELPTEHWKQQFLTKHPMVGIEFGVVQVCVEASFGVNP